MFTLFPWENFPGAVKYSTNISHFCTAFGKKIFKKHDPVLYKKGLNFFTSEVNSV
jgi:hypothetical protein